MNDADINAQVRGLIPPSDDHSHFPPPLSSVQFFSPLTAPYHVRQSSSEFLGNELRWPQSANNSVVELLVEESSSPSVFTAMRYDEPTAATTFFAKINGIDTSGIEHYHHPLIFKPNVKPGMSNDSYRAIKSHKPTTLPSQFESPLIAKMMHGAPPPSLAERYGGTDESSDLNGLSSSMLEEYYALKKPPMTKSKPGQVEHAANKLSTTAVASPIPKKRKLIEGPRKPQKRFTANLLYNRFGQLYSNNSGPLTAEMMNKVLFEKQHFTNHVNKTPLTTNVARKVEALDPVTLEQRYVFDSCSDAARTMNINRTKMSRTCRSGGGELGSNPVLVYRYVEFSALIEPQVQEIHESKADDLGVAGPSPIVVSSEEDTQVRGNSP